MIENANTNIIPFDAMKFRASRAKQIKAAEARDFLHWTITPEEVQQFCDDNDEPALTDAEMERFFTILHEQFDPYEIIVEAMHCLRTGKSRFHRE
jgi:hypothetical protein